MELFYFSNNSIFPYQFSNFSSSFRVLPFIWAKYFQINQPITYRNSSFYFLFNYIFGLAFCHFCAFFIRIVKCQDYRRRSSTMFFENKIKEGTSWKNIHKISKYQTKHFCFSNFRLYEINDRLIYRRYEK